MIFFGKPVSTFPDHALEVLRSISPSLIVRVTKAGIVAAGIPSAALSPFAPGDVIGVLTERSSRLYGRAIEALAGVARV